MKLLSKRRKLGNQGLSLIELLCSIAILSILGTVAGSILVVSAHSYQRENADTGAQKEAQLVANQISDLLIDTTAEVETNNSVAEGRNVTDNLIIIQGDMGYKIEFVSADMKLYYSQFTVDGTGNRINYTDSQLMAENLVNFYADASDFEETGNVKLDMIYARGEGEYPAAVTVTSRNKELTSGSTAPSVFVTVPSEIILEPNQSYTINATVSGMATGLKYSIVGSVKPNTTVSLNGGQITIDSAENVNMFMVRVDTTATDGAGAPLVTKYIRVYVRKITDIRAVAVLVSGMPMKAGAVYNIASTLGGQNLAQAVGQDWDTDYIDAAALGAGYTVSDDYGGQASGAYSYYVLPSGALQLTLHADIPDDKKIEVTAIAKHPKGVVGGVNTNKTGLPYNPDVKDTFTLKRPTSVMDIANGWMRRSNDPQATVRGDKINTVKSTYGGTHHEVEFMFREYPNGTFQSEWLPNIYGDANNSMTVNLRTLITGVMDYRKDYEMKIRLIVKDDAGNIVWPTATTPPEEYIIQSVMKKVSITFDSPMLGLSGATQNDPSSAPSISMKKGETYGGDGSFLKYKNVIGIDLNGTDFENKICYIVEKKVGSSWVACDSSQVSVQNPNTEFKMKFEQSGFTGDYRIKVYVKDQSRYSIDATGKLTETHKEDYILYDETTGNNIFYFHANEVF